jgi:hypothetical protein
MVWVSSAWSWLAIAKVTQLKSVSKMFYILSKKISTEVLSFSVSLYLDLPSTESKLLPQLP